MRKYVIGFIAGVVCAIGGTAFADDISLVGKKIVAEVPIKINGQTVSRPGIVVEGTTYLPVRSAGELFGYSVSYAGKSVVMEAKEEPKVTEPEEPVTEPEPKEPKEPEQPDNPSDPLNASEIQKRIDDLKSERSQHQGAIIAANVIIKDAQKMLDETSDAGWQKAIDFQKQRIANAEAEIARIDAEIAQLEKQLAELQKSSP